MVLNENSGSFGHFHPQTLRDLVLMAAGENSPRAWHFYPSSRVDALTGQWFQPSSPCLKMAKGFVSKGDPTYVFLKACPVIQVVIPKNARCWTEAHMNEAELSDLNLSG